MSVLGNLERSSHLRRDFRGLAVDAFIQSFSDLPEAAAQLEAAHDGTVDLCLGMIETCLRKN